MRFCTLTVVYLKKKNLQINIMTFKKKLLILGASEMQLPLIIRARELGYYTVVADYNSTAPGFVYANEKLPVSTNDVDTLVAYSRENKIDGVLTTSDFPVNSVAIISKELGLSAMSRDVADICTNKYKQRTVLKEVGINHPFFKLCNTVSDLKSLHNFPYIVKPIDSSASRGIKLVKDKDELLSAYYEALSYSKSNNTIVEEFIKGREFSVETLTQNYKTHIIAITEKITKGKNIGRFVEDTQIEPAKLTEPDENLIRNIVLDSIYAIGLNNCPSHTEVMLSDRGCFIIEIACRLGGDYITSDLVPLSTGVDMLENLINIALGLPIITEQLFHKSASVQFLNTENYFKCLDFIKSNHPSIIRYEVKPYNDKRIENSLDRLGYVIFSTDTRKEMDLLLKIFL
ncbi:MAG: ATP-grasp domain-containing protein [Bacteroidales bacterium]|nr:ATP-grasp domain-containing protein [Bacteroidales bacterium]